jgi:hypothetical protein
VIPKRWIEAYLHFLLRHRRAMTLLVALASLGFVFSLQGLRVHTDFFDFYPPEHPYIRTYQEFRRMFGSANVLTVILEVEDGDIYNPPTLQTLDRMTKYVIESRGVIPYQILSIAHPRVKSISTYADAIQVRPVFHPGVPQTQEDADRVKFAVYSTRGVRGLLVSLDDRSAAIHAGFWEEALDFHYLHERLTALKTQEEADGRHRVYITGFPWLFTSIMRYVPDIGRIFVLTALTLGFLLWNYFRTWTGIWVPVFSGVLSSVWGLGFATLLGFNLDPLVLVIPIFLTARALSHSVQSMDRYHEEYHRLRDKDAAIVESYSHLFAPAIASIVTDGMGLLIIAGGLCTSVALNLTLAIAVAGWVATRVAPGPRRWLMVAGVLGAFAVLTVLTPRLFPVALVPLIRKVAVFASFWIVSIFVSVVTLHPIILSFIAPPGTSSAPTASRWRRSLDRAPVALAALATIWGVVALEVWRLLGPVTWALVVACAVVLVRWPEEIYRGITGAVIAMSRGSRRWVVLGGTGLVLVVGWGYGRTLRVGDMTPGAALLFSDHPYNVAYHKLNEQFYGANQLIVIADTHAASGMKNVEPLTIIEEFADHMETAEGAGASVTIIDIVKQLARLYHEGEPKWSFVPEDPKHVAELFYVFTQTGHAGDLDRFMDPTARYGSITTFFHGYSNQIITDAIAWAKKFAVMYGGPQVDFLFAGGLFGVLAAVNEAVESSYWINLGVIFAVVTLCLYLTYASWAAALILMVPVVLSQVVCEAIMVIFRIDLNVNSLPIAAAGAAVGVDYGIYHFSRMIDAFDAGKEPDDAVDYATATTGKAIIFTASTMLASTIFWRFAALKFQAEMGILLALLMAFNTFGGLVVVPALVKILRPAFLVERREQTLARDRRRVAALGSAGR